MYVALCGAKRVELKLSYVIKCKGHNIQLMVSILYHWKDIDKNVFCLILSVKG